MLTKQDLKNIGDLIETKLEFKLDEKLAPIQKDIKGIKRDIKRINTNIERDFGFHETQNLHVIKSVQTIQKNLGLPVMSTVAS